MLRKTPYLLGTVLLLSTVAVFAAISFVGIPRLMTSSVTEQDPFAENIVPETVAAESIDPVEPVVIQPPTAVPTTIATAIPKAVFAPSVTPDVPVVEVEMEAVAVVDEGSDDVPVVTGDVVAGEPIVGDAEEAVVEAATVEVAAEVVEETRIRSTATAWLYSSIAHEERWLGWFLAPELEGTVLGRTPGGEWLLVQTADDGIKGWVSAEHTEFISGELRDVTLSDYSAPPWSDQEKPFIDLVSESTAFEAPVAVAQVVAVITEPPATTWPTNTPSPTIIATPWPTKTPWPTNTPQSTDEPEALPPQPTAMLAQPTATIKWEPTATAQPLPTALPTVRPTATRRPVATATPLPTQTVAPTTAPVAVASEPDAAPTQPAPVSSSNAIAWWHLDRESVQSSGATWQMVLIVRVPTSFDYSFEIDNRTSSIRTVRNDDGDDFFSLTLSGISCGSPFSAELLAYQNGARMVAQNEFTLEVGTVFINSPC